ncbi:flagellar basal body rod protein FlgC [Halioglobus japonicus]|uniref:Flagellar basal-body rod protein FlgC n=1 Tax=Halioglobus japonicus TaxID=930805 RepID=A0AAP8SMY9_9GAMM|nr:MULTISPECIES: flagellar basal body rod protein FlgC [Halioglobus]AQA18080.1 flagellar basal body rod protein FlgC [Halioglobus japonicus]KZX54861.1 flagellar basal body rod protein FlgC [Halioglobus sp. HI00S01]PLW86072.1 flagellar basal body rod protein FlgC [Halioglobus japonicus]GHD14632.1 flagellar basal-body rod protein FlgC [Halioglobus japonicus]
MFSIFNISSSALAAQSQRLNVAASNMANSGSVAGPGREPYRARHLIFESQAGGMGGVQTVGIVHSNKPFASEYRPDHPLADAEGNIRKPNVEPVHEMVDMMAASRSYQASVEVMNTTKQLMLKTLTLGEN